MEGNNLSKDDKKEIKAVLKHLGERKEAGGVSPVQKINRAEIARADDDEAAIISNTRISRDASGNLNFNSLRSAARSGGRGRAAQAPLSRSATRAAAMRAEINYNKMSNIIGDSGRNLQKETYAKLHSIDPSRASSISKINNIAKNNINTDLHLGVNSGGGSGHSNNIRLAA